MRSIVENSIPTTCYRQPVEGEVLEHSVGVERTNSKKNSLRTHTQNAISFPSVVEPNDRCSKLLFEDFFCLTATRHPPMRTLRSLLPALFFSFLGSPVLNGTRHELLVPKWCSSAPRESGSLRIIMFALHFLFAYLCTHFPPRQMLFKLFKIHFRCLEPINEMNVVLELLLLKIEIAKQGVVAIVGFININFSHFSSQPVA